MYGRSQPKPGVAYFFSRPSSGGACKRLNLFLRWMVRHDKVDLGVWTRVRPGQLIVPLDTHVIRVGRCLQLTRFKSPGWKMAADITASLRKLDPLDPVKFDFSICHLGMMNACGFGKKAGDMNCPLKGACRPEQPPRQIRRTPEMTRLVSWGEIRLGLRLIAKQPILSATIILALATGIGLATMGFTLRDAIVHGTLPYDGGERFARFNVFDRDGGRIDLDLERYHAFLERAASFEHIGAVGPAPVHHHAWPR